MKKKTLATFSCLLLLASFALSGRPASEKQASEESITTALEQQQREREILNSLDNLELENELFELEQGNNSPAQNSAPGEHWQEFSDLEEMSALDSFEQIQLPPLLTDEPADEWLQPAELSPAETLYKSGGELDSQESGVSGVGIAGEQENLINSLDNSDLMDFEDDLDMWSDDLVEEHTSDDDNYY